MYAESKNRKLGSYFMCLFIPFCSSFLLWFIKTCGHDGLGKENLVLHSDGLRSSALKMVFGRSVACACVKLKGELK